MSVALPNLDLRPDHWAIVRDALRRHVPDRVAIAFGSRATWTAKDYSDLDLAIMGEEPLSLRASSALDETLVESDLPFRVDIVDWARIDDGFRGIIRQHGVVVQSATGSSQGKGAGHPAVSCAEGWREARLGEVVRFLSGGTPSKKCAAYWNGEIPWVSAKEMKQFRLRDTTEKVTVAALANGAKQVPAGTVLLLTRGMRLLKEVPVCVVQQPMTFNQDIKALESKADVDPEFLPYLLLGKTDLLRNLVDLAGHGTGRINTDELSALGVSLPGVREQRAIAHVLGALDDKIELSRRMNETLEAMARALFKSWFVDFDPVRAKMEGRDTGLPNDIADLFPDRMVDSETGEIPEGWRRRTLADLARLNPESWSSRNAPNRIQYVDLANTKWGSINDIQEFTWEDAPSRGRRVLRRGDTIVGTVRPRNGSFALIDRDGLTGSTAFAVLCPATPTDRELIWCAATSQDAIERLAHLADGGAYPAVRPRAVLDTVVALPDARIRLAFSSFAATVVNRMGATQRESRTLADLRDILLPKLISGEIRVPGAERLVASVP